MSAQPTAVQGRDAMRSYKLHTRRYNVVPTSLFQLLSSSHLPSTRSANSGPASLIGTVSDMDHGWQLTSSLISHITFAVQDWRQRFLPFTLLDSLYERKLVYYCNQSR